MLSPQTPRYTTDKLDKPPFATSVAIHPSASMMASNGWSYPSAPPGQQQQQLQQQQQPPWIEENGRYYGSYLPGRYMMPIDESELDRLDIFHKFFSVARKEDSYGGLHEAQISTSSPRVLDLGCGTGIWAIDMADRYRYAKIYGLDLNYTQPESIPPGIEFRRQDIEEPQWNLDLDSFDLVHMQLMAGSIANWGALYQTIFRHLKPGTGIVEHVEIDFTPLSSDNSLPADSKLRYWHRELALAYEARGQPLVLEPQTEVWLKQAGFEDIKRNIKEIPYHPWPQNEVQKDIGRWFNLGMVHGMEAMSMAPLTRHRGYTQERVKALLAEVKREICTRALRSHCTMYIYTARKPNAQRH